MFHKSREFLRQMSDCQLLEDDSAPYSCLRECHSQSAN